VKTVRTNAPISSAKLSAIMARESLDIPGNARLAVHLNSIHPSGDRFGMLGIKNQKPKNVPLTPAALLNRRPLICRSYVLACENCSTSAGRH
jgi:hypothetical protein